MVDQKNPALEELAPWVGNWAIEITFPGDPPTIVHGRAEFAWIEGGAFLLMRSEVDWEGPTDSLGVIGCDDAGTDYTVLYFDARGVSRVYQMSFANGVWRQWRDAPGFAQRFAGTFGEDGNTITATWEASTDGTTWEHDFDLTFTRAT
jgi:hypothetical protein